MILGDALLENSLTRQERGIGRVPTPSDITHHFVKVEVQGGVFLHGAAFVSSRGVQTRRGYRLKGCADWSDM